MLEKCVALVTNPFHVGHLVIFVDKGKRGEEGPRGKQGGRVSELYSCYELKCYSLYSTPSFLYNLINFLSSEVFPYWS